VLVLEECVGIWHFIFPPLVSFSSSVTAVFSALLLGVRVFLSFPCASSREVLVSRLCFPVSSYYATIHRPFFLVYIFQDCFFLLPHVRVVSFFSTVA